MKLFQYELKFISFENICKIACKLEFHITSKHRIPLLSIWLSDIKEGNIVGVRVCAGSNYGFS